MGAAMLDFILSPSMMAGCSVNMIVYVSIVVTLSTVRLHEGFRGWVLDVGWLRISCA